MFLKSLLFVLLVFPLHSFCQKKAKVVRTYSYSVSTPHRHGQSDFFFNVHGFRNHSHVNFPVDAIGPFPITRGRWESIHYTYPAFHVYGSYYGHHIVPVTGTRIYHSPAGRNVYMYRDGKTIVIGKGVLN